MSYYNIVVNVTTDDEDNERDCVKDNNITKKAVNIEMTVHTYERRNGEPFTIELDQDKKAEDYVTDEEKQANVNVDQETRNLFASGGKTGPVTLLPLSISPSSTRFH